MTLTGEPGGPSVMAGVALVDVITRTARDAVPRLWVEVFGGPPGRAFGQAFSFGSLSRAGDRLPTMPGSGPVAWPPAPIRTERLVLRESEARDRAAFIELFASPDVRTYLGGPDRVLSSNERCPRCPGGALACS
jgi:hypothetical protein